MCANKSGLMYEAFYANRVKHVIKEGVPGNNRPCAMPPC